MLVLERKPGQSIKIGDEIEIYVLEIKSKAQIKIGIQAPENIDVKQNNAAIRTRTSNDKEIG